MGTKPPPCGVSSLFPKAPVLKVSGSAGLLLAVRGSAKTLGLSFFLS